MSILSTHSTRISYSALIAVIVCPLHPLFVALHAPRCPAARLPLVAGKAEICRRQPGLEEVGGRWNCSKPEWIHFLFSDSYHCPLSWFPCLCQMQSAGFQAWKNVPLVLMLRQQQKKGGEGGCQCILVHSHEYYLRNLCIYFGMRFCHVPASRSTTPFFPLPLELQSLTLEHHGLLQEELSQKQKQKKTSNRLKKCHAVCCIQSRCILVSLQLRCNKGKGDVKTKKWNVMHSVVSRCSPPTCTSMYQPWTYISGGSVSLPIFSTCRTEVRAVVCRETSTGPPRSVKESQDARRPFWGLWGVALIGGRHCGTAVLCTQASKRRAFDTNVAHHTV